MAPAAPAGPTPETDSIGSILLRFPPAVANMRKGRPNGTAFKDVAGRDPP